MSNRQHPLGPFAAAHEAQQQNESVMDQLPAGVRPHKVPMAVAFGAGGGPDGTRVLIMQVFTALGVTVYQWTPEEWEQLSAQAEEKLVEVRSSLVIAQPGVIPGIELP